MEKENRINQYQDTYLSQYGFEAQMVKYRRKLLMERLMKIKPMTVVEVGCGAELLYQHYFQEAGAVDRWVIIEPGSEFYGVAADSGLPNLVAIQGFFEEAIPQIRVHLPAPPDLIIMSSVLHEVASALELLTAAQSIMGEKSVLHVNVPNATSFHRRLARSMGLINDEKVLSERNRELLQHRVYDRECLKEEIEKSGLAIASEGGYLIKPFTHAQMQAISPHLGEAVLNGLYQMGKDLPEMASEIYVEACKAC